MRIIKLVLFLFIVFKATYIKGQWGQPYSGQCVSELVSPAFTKSCNSNPWILAFEDNFDGNQIDLSKWDVKESVIRGFSNPTAWMSSNNVEVSNGTLKLIATQNTPPLQGTYVTSDSSLTNKNPSYEANLYLNKTTLSQSGVINKYGFGASLLYLLYKKQFFNFFSGIEYSNNNFIKDKLFIDRFSSYNDVEVNAHTLLFPANFRFNIKSIFFLEPGIYVASIFRGRSSGKIITYNNITHQYDSYYENDNFSSNLYYGSKIGVGFKLPIKNLKFILKTEYNHAFTGIYILDEFFKINTFRFSLGIVFN